MKEGKGPREVVRREGLRLKAGKDGQSLLVVRSTRSNRDGNNVFILSGGRI